MTSLGALLRLARKHKSIRPHVPDRRPTRADPLADVARSDKCAPCRDFVAVGPLTMSIQFRWRLSLK